MRTMHLFAGAGGGILADLILGHTPVVAVEWESYCCQALRERVADGWFPGMHVWEGDVRMFDSSEYTGRVDIIAAGFPCQDISTAGNRGGIGEDTRSGLYREILRIADVVRPEKIFMENVSAILSLRERITLIAIEKIRRQSLFSAEGEGKTARFIRHIIEIGEQAALGRVLEDLSSRGFDAVWCCLSAAEVGAKHKRDRWWLLGYTKHAGQPAAEIGEGSESGNDSNATRTKQASEPSGPGEQHGHVDNTTSQSRNGGRTHKKDGESQTSESGGDGSKDNVPNTDCKLPHRRLVAGERGRAESSDCYSEISNPNPNPNHVQGLVEESQQGRHRRQAGLHDREASTPEASWWQVESEVGRVVDGLANRTHQLKALGNGQVPLQAAVAFSVLWQMMQAAND